MKNKVLSKEHEIGLGGVAIGTAFENITDNQAETILNEAWEAGIRYFDTSPWYGLTRSERRFGHFLSSKKRDDYVFSTKVGRIFYPASQAPPTMWKNPLGYDFRHGYTHDATMKSIEESLVRSGLDRIDIVYVHDLSEDQVGDRYQYFLKQAKKGAFKTLSQLRDEGVIKAWGMGVNKIEPILDCIQYADPDICLSATQYSILEHDDAVEYLLPIVKEAGISLVSGAGYNSGYLAGRKRYNYKDLIPVKILEKKKKLDEIAKAHHVNLTHAALQFVLASDEFVSIIPGASKPEQVRDNINARNSPIPIEFWNDLRSQNLIHDDAKTPS